MAWQHISPEVTLKGCKKCCISTAVDKIDDNMWWNSVKRMGLLEVSVRKMRTLTVQMETVRLISKGRCNLTCFVY
jgi:hypothetical protein